MGYYTEYLDRNLNGPELNAERKAQLRQIAALRGNRDVLVYASDLDKAGVPAAKLMIAYDDLLPINDQVQNLSGKKLDLILETGGGSGEVAEDIVRLLRDRYEEVAIIVPGWAKSAGTIIAMAGDEILMEPASALGPIDAQIGWQGKVFSADALIEGMEKIKKEVKATGNLNRAYIPMLQTLSPGEIQSAENALNFAKKLVTDWLVRYKFKNWDTHSSTGAKVSDEERQKRAEEIAGTLCNHRMWLTHGRSIKIQDLETMRLIIKDYSKELALAEAIRRYHTLLQMTFGSNVYKVIETPDSQIYRFVGQSVPPPPQDVQQANTVFLDVQCNNCNATSKLQVNLKKSPLQPGLHAFPANNRFQCPKCGVEIDLSGARRQIELQSKQAIVDEYA
ncbi:MAG: Clp protease ClpP [bacterium]|nr:Clp protease ClpP [bacterium]